LTVHNHQRKYVLGHDALHKAYQRGQQFWRDLYGEPLIEKTYESFTRGNLGSAARNAYTLMKCYPERFFIFALRRIKRLGCVLKKGSSGF